jgi:hypothetical protein
MIDVGYTPDTPEEKILKDWRTERYHAPSDDTNQPVDLTAAAAYEELIRALTVEIANDPARPAWKPDSFFRRYATSPLGIATRHWPSGQVLECTERAR